MFLKGALVALVCWSAVAACSTQASQAVRSPCDRPANAVMTAPDVRYGGGVAEKLDLYLPWQRTGEPLIVFVHGGGWSGGDKRLYGHIGTYFARCGVALANVDYPLAPNARADAQAAAILDATSWLVERAAIYGYDGDRIFLMGHSAGAELVALAAVTSRLALPRAPKISGVVAISGLGYEPEESSTNGALPPYIARFYQTAFGPDASHWRRFDIARLLRRHEPPFLIIHGRQDTFAPEADSEELVRTLRRSGNAVTYLQPGGRDHNSVLAVLAPESNDPTGLEVKRFIYSGSL